MISRKTMVAFVFGASLATTAAFTLAGLAEAQTGANQPRMQAALAALTQAKSELQNAAENKGGHRVNALNLVNQAIVEVQAGMAAAN